MKFNILNLVVILFASSAARAEWKIGESSFQVATITNVLTGKDASKGEHTDFFYTKYRLEGNLVIEEYETDTGQHRYTKVPTSMLMKSIGLNIRIDSGDQDRSNRDPAVPYDQEIPIEGLAGKTLDQIYSSPFKGGRFVDGLIALFGVFLNQTLALNQSDIYISNFEPILRVGKDFGFAFDKSYIEIQLKPRGPATFWKYRDTTAKVIPIKEFKNWIINN